MIGELYIINLNYSRKMIKNNPRYLLVDRFVDTVQQYIYTLIVKYIENMLLNQNCDMY